MALVSFASLTRAMWSDMSFATENRLRAIEGRLEELQVRLSDAVGRLVDIERDRVRVEPIVLPEFSDELRGLGLQPPRGE